MNRILLTERGLQLTKNIKVEILQKDQQAQRKISNTEQQKDNNIPLIKQQVQDSQYLAKIVSRNSISPEKFRKSEILQRNKQYKQRTQLKFQIQQQNFSKIKKHIVQRYQQIYLENNHFHSIKSDINEKNYWNDWKSYENKCDLIIKDNELERNRLINRLTEHKKANWDKLHQKFSVVSRLSPPKFIPDRNIEFQPKYHTKSMYNFRPKLQNIQLSPIHIDNLKSQTGFNEQISASLKSTKLEFRPITNSIGVKILVKNQYQQRYRYETIQ